MEDLDRAAREPLAFIAAVFVQSQFLEAIRGGKIPDPARQAIGLHLEGRSPILDEDSIRRSNTGDGLNLLVINTGCARTRLSHQDYSMVLIQRTGELVSTHEGYNCKEFLAQAYDADSLRVATNAGGYVRDWNRRAGSDGTTLPHLVGLTRKEALSNPGTWISRLFLYQPPRIFFDGSEQDVLALALRGADDEEIGNDLHMSVSGVKKRWARIYERVLVTVPGMLPADEDRTRGRGVEKRWLLLRYLREHPEELRPWERPRYSCSVNATGFNAAHDSALSCAGSR